ncbi:hypothetical protein FOQG_06138 [Fusarium oxysporum f. sp. raphani 54005]|uniref:Uncharacterized protein n=3 Tax=Fusarium oxysporum TaxID=5507 RepID=X0CCX0_FUSOX|nr:hypothetical protein FOVG_06695 [Fusarium oxysporum f. sp. pisi HDV247]EXK92260.1 hypothetical protein FOQG_06138 [Fusarium oxysporum f. sp. raphani 54005]EXM23585.1 hypothetical protein FOTG_09039 [Fusarium oxysporum f. sp. vasinfectum 25433]
MSHSRSECIIAWTLELIPQSLLAIGSVHNLLKMA